MAAATMRGSPDTANENPYTQIGNGVRRVSGSRKYSADDQEVGDYGEDMDSESPAEETYRRPASKSKPIARPGQPGRSFSVRARDANLNYTTRKPAPEAPPGLSEESTTPRGLPLASYPPDADAASAQEHESVPPPEAPIAPSNPSPLSRSNTTHSTSSQRRDWASDRSPLQKLEVTLNGISKEEKRARVQEAEMRLRERLARQKVEREKAEAAAAAAAGAAAVAARPTSNQSSRSESRTTPAAEPKYEQKDVMLEETARDVPMQRQPGGPGVRHSRNISMNPQYPTSRRPEDGQLARAEAVIPPSAKIGSVPRRLVTLSGPAARPGPSDDMRPTRSISQTGPSKPRQATGAPIATAIAAPAVSAALANEARVLGTSAAQGSVESYSKPKKQSVSFNVPPPTPPPIFEWKTAPTARLGSTDFDFQRVDIDRGKAWWEGGGTTNRRKSRALPKNYQTPAQKLTGESPRYIHS